MITTFRKSTIRLLVTMVMVSVMITACSVLILYQSTMAHRKESLKQLVENEKGYILTIYQLTGDSERLISFIKQKQSMHPGPGKTGEFMISESDGSDTKVIYPEPVDISSAGDPALLAATGNTGFTRGTDYKGNNVIAYAEYLPELEWGLVVKMNFAEVVKPIWKASMFILFALIFLVISGILLFQKFSNPLLRRILESEEKYHMIFELIPSGITIADIHGDIIESNLESEKLLGISRDSITPQKIDSEEWKIIRPDHTAMPPSEYASTIALREKRVVKNTEMGIVKPGDKVTWLNVSAAPFPVANLGVIVVYSDITRRVEAEKKLQAHDYKMMEYAQQLGFLNDTKDKFFNIIAHDLKNPFSSLLGASEYLYSETEKFDATKTRKLAKILHDSAKNGYDILANLLEWSRSQTGSLPFKPELTNLFELVDKNLKLVAVQASEKDIDLTVSMKKDLTLTVDPNMMNTILRNLLTNALKFTYPGGSVEITAKRIGEEIHIAIRDTGIGIPDVDQDKLFRIDEKFVKNGTNQEKGTGLGLILCKELVEKHSGSIRVESEVGKGSVFIISLPAEYTSS